jgi:hypothetical protein
MTPMLLRNFSPICLSLLAGCAGTALTREVLVPIPEHAPRAVATDVRGTAREAARIAPDQQYAILAEVVRRFYRPMMQQARWIDPRPLGHQRARDADSLVKENPDWALAIVEAANVRRVCPLNEANAQCRGMNGGVLRFSTPYGVGATGDSALVFVRYTPVRFGVESEMEFLMARYNGVWSIASKRTLPAIVATSGPKPDFSNPQVAFESLMEADRAFASAAKTTDLVTALSSMFVGNVVLQSRGRLVRGVDSARIALAADTLNARSRASWTPVGGGVSSDGEHGFTYGYMTATRADGSTQPLKYLAYWVRGESGWRVAVYKRSLRAAGEVSLAQLPPSMPQLGLPRGDAATAQRYADELSLAEHAFSRDATPMGLGPAFVKWGAPDAINLGGQSVEIVRGPEAIGKLVGASWQPGSTISWAPEQVIVSSTGDLGVSIGTIKVATPATAERPAANQEIAFFTVWKRKWPTDPWRYVAE